MQTDNTYDVVVVGGGAAGLSGALVLARSRRSVLVVDAGHPRNAPAAGVHALLGHDGIPPAELLARGRAEVTSYGGTVREGEVVAATRDGDGFVVQLADGARIGARRLLVTTGLVDELPDVPGLRERWGRDVVHCPYCHGWEVRDKAIGVLAGGPMSVHQAQLFRQLSDRVTYLVDDSAPPGPEQLEELAARDVEVVTQRVHELEVEGDRLVGVRLADGSSVPLDALAVAPRMVARAGFLAGLGLEPVAHPSGMGLHLPVDATGRTSAEGVWAAGNVTDISAQVGPSAAAGAMAAGQINADIVAEETRAAVARRLRRAG